MDCVEETALKSSIQRETTISSQQLYLDDVFSFNSVNGVSSEEFSVDDLLDLSSEQFESLTEEEEKDSVSFSSRLDDDGSNSRNQKGLRSLDSFPSVPVDDWKDLEWLSNFVDDSGSEFSLSFPLEKTGFRAPRPYRSNPVVVALNRKVRSKRRRRRLNSTSFLPFIFEKPVMKKIGRKVKPPVGPVQRRCSHCQVQKTPQWRTGPFGAKTLCNACGVRFKSGRLFPEYRPACSPTFSVEVHSNSHRKVMELRKKKETVGGPEIRSELSGVVEPVSVSTG